EAYACTKALPFEFLQRLGLETIANPYAPGQRAVKVPYLTTEGALHRNRIRAALKPSPDADHRMLWDKQPEGLGTIHPLWSAPPERDGADHLGRGGERYADALVLRF